MIQHNNLPMSLDALIQLVHLRGLYISNLYQFRRASDSRIVWQANLTDMEKYWDWGKGETAEEALTAALHLAATTNPEPPAMQRGQALATSVKTVRTPVPTEDLF
jgi:hypothetical protein